MLERTNLGKTHQTTDICDAMVNIGMCVLSVDVLMCINTQVHTYKYVHLSFFVILNLYFFCQCMGCLWKTFKVYCGGLIFMGKC